MDSSASDLNQLLGNLVESQVQSLFRRGSHLFAEESHAETKGLKILFYVAYMLRLFDPSGEIVALELQHCVHERDVPCNVFLRVFYYFPDYVIDTVWNCQGDKKCPPTWQSHAIAAVYDVFGMSTGTVDHFLTLKGTELVLSCWQSTLYFGCISMRI